jgi:hypothetical protein
MTSLLAFEFTCSPASRDFVCLAAAALADRLTRPFTLIDAIEWGGCLTGILGAWMLASKTKYSGWGFVVYLLSNTLWMAFGLITGSPGMVVMQIAFTGASAIGIWRWLVAPGILARRGEAR